MKDKYFLFLTKQFPDLAEGSQALIADQLISPYQVDLPLGVLEQAQKIVSHLYSLREDSHYQKTVASHSSPISSFDPGNKSICMSYDFHLNPEGDLKLIEVNTNAAFLLMGYYLYQAKQQALPIADFSPAEIIDNCREEASLSGQSLNTIAIADEAPSSQRLFIEFLLYQQLFQQHGYKTFIADPTEFKNQGASLHLESDKIDFVYNRSTDFFLEQLSHHGLRESYLQNGVTVSPNPHEYSLLADKNRLIEWSLDLQRQTPEFSHLQPIQSHILSTQYLTADNAPEIWSQKKRYFFKPLTSFGSKGSYRGEGISRNYFDQLIGNNCLAQEFCPADERLFKAEGFPDSKLKYDLRFYAYKGRIQMVIARLYQGQVTNLRTPLGGFATVHFS